MFRVLVINLSIENESVKKIDYKGTMTKPIRRTEIFPFPFLSQGIFGEKLFPKFSKAFPDLKVIGKTFPATSKTFPSR